MSVSSAQSPSAAELSRLLQSADPPQDVLARLRERGFVAAPDASVEFTADRSAPQPDLTAAVAHIDPRRPQAPAALPGAKLGMYVADCSLNTEAEPAYLRLPSFSSHFPYLIAYLLGFPPGTTRNLLVRMQVFSTGGTVRLTGTGNPTAVTVGFTSFPVSVPISVTTTAGGFASVLVQRNGQTGFDWHAVDVL